jgi:hypothetical protein
MMAGRSALNKQALFMGIEALNGGKCVNSSHHAKLLGVMRKQWTAQRTMKQEIKR